MFFSSALVMLNLFQHNALPLVILKQVQNDETLFGETK
jgi:hypothetical protein